MVQGNLTLADLLNVTIRLTEITDPNVDKIYAGDIYAALKIMSFVVDKSNTTMRNISTRELGDVFQVSP